MPEEPAISFGTLGAVQGHPQILAAPTQQPDRASDQSGRIAAQRLTQRLAQTQASDRRITQTFLQTPAGHLDFGQFGHEVIIGASLESPS